jgi:small-conductance mechanosensitive channel
MQNDNKRFSGDRDGFYEPSSQVYVQQMSHTQYVYKEESMEELLEAGIKQDEQQREREKEEEYHSITKRLTELNESLEPMRKELAMLQKRDRRKKVNRNSVSKSKKEMENISMLSFGRSVDGSHSIMTEDFEDKSI